MNYSSRTGIAATLLGLLITANVSGSGPSNNLPSKFTSNSSSNAEPAAQRANASDTVSNTVPAHSAATKTVHITVDALTDRHTISTYVYGGAYPQDAATITDSGLTEVRWGGDATSTYNWKLDTYNAANDYYFEDYAANGFNNGSDGNSAQFIKDVIAAGSNPLMTMVMLPWVAQSPETSVSQGGTNNYHWSFSVAQYGAQCSVDPYNTDAGDGIVSGTCGNPTYL